MENQHLFPAKCRVLSGSAIKLIAVVAMLIDHTGFHFTAPGFVLFSVGGMEITLYRLMRDVGRLAFPLFVFLMIEGFFHTRSRLRYGVSLAACALLSELPWDLAHYGVPLAFESQNVFFTLLLGYGGMCACERLRRVPLAAAGVLVGLAVVSLLGQADYGVNGYVFILLLFALRHNELVRPLTAFLLGNCWFVLPAFVLMSLYNGKRGFIQGAALKYAFYLFYPVHLLLIYLAKCFLLT